MRVWIAVVAALIAWPGDSALAEDRRDTGRSVEVLHNPPGENPILGPRFAPVTIELFGDLTDWSNTAKAYFRFVELARRHPLRLRIIFRLHKKDRAGGDNFAEAAYEAFAQGRFHRYLAAFYGARRRTPPRDQLPRIAESAGVDFKRIEEALIDHRHAERVVDNYWRARRFGLNRVPSALVNGEPLSRIPDDIEELEAIYDRAYAAAKSVMADGYSVAQVYDRMLVLRSADLTVPEIAVGALDGASSARARRTRRNGRPISGPIDYSGPHAFGDSQAPATLVLYCNFASRNCAAIYQSLRKLESAYRNQVRLVFKPLYDPEVSRDAHRLQVAAECVAEQRDFWDFFRNVYTRFRSRSDLGAYIRREVEALDVDVDRFETCVANRDSDPRLLDQLTDAERTGITQTPSIVIGGRVYLGALTFKELASLVELELAPGLLSVWLDQPDT